MSASTKNWCLTINNPTPKDYECFKKDATVFKYWGYAYEVGDLGTPHLQGFVSLVKKSRMAAASQLFPRARLVMMRGSFGQNELYCAKQSILTTFGVAPLESAQRQKIDWQKAKDLMKAGNFDELEPDIFIRYYATARRIAKDYMVKPMPLEAVCGMWIWGEPGAGKTHAVVHAYPERYIKPINKWWDGYQMEEVVHLDEVSPSHSGWIDAYLKKWADKWPCDAEVKGGALQIRPKKLIVTSNYSIDQMGWDAVTTSAIKRRFTEIKKELGQNIII